MSLFPALGKLRRTLRCGFLSLLTASSAKELEHFERIRQTFESVDKQKQESVNGASGPPQTIQDALDALNPGGQLEFSMGGPVANGDAQSPAVNKGKGKQIPSMVRNASGQSTSSKGKGKSPAGAGGKAKGKTVNIPNGDSDSSLDGPTFGLRTDQGGSRGYDDVGEDEEDNVENGIVHSGDEDDYIIRTDHLAPTGGSGL